MSPLANMLTIIKNAQAVGHKSVIVPFSRMKLDVANTLKAQGYIGDVEKRQKKLKKSEVPYIHIMLQYKDDEGVIHGTSMKSKPSRRLYSGKNDLKPVRSGYGVSVISTSKGIMTGKEAYKAGLGGELLFEIW